jgi:hypothetical protein
LSIEKEARTKARDPIMRVPCSQPLALRINHVSGERLRAADLQDELGVESWMRQLHMIGLHDTWGIALGLGVGLEEEAMRGVRVTAGLAYDARGRPLLLEAPHVAPNPWSIYPAAEPSATFDLVLIADAERDRRPADRDDGLCLSCSVVPQRDRPALVWRPAASVRLGIDVALARARRAFPKDPIKPGDPPPLLALDMSVRRFAESQARPHIAAATTTPDQAWQPWIPPGQQDILGFQALVDVSDWGFASAPTLLASLSLDFAAAPRTLLLIELVRSNRLYLTHVDLDWENQPGQFRFVVIPAVLAFLDPSTVPKEGLGAGQSYRSPFQIAWIGVEPVVGCPLGIGEVLGQRVRCCEPAEQPLRFRPSKGRRLP